MNLEKIEKFLKEEGDKINSGYYREPNVSYVHLTEEDKKQIKLYQKKITDFQNKILDLFRVKENIYDKNYGIILTYINKTQDENMQHRIVNILYLITTIRNILNTEYSYLKENNGRFDYITKEVTQTSQ